jgi:ketosteroid isomerase-like protein
MWKRPSSKISPDIKHITASNLAYYKALSKRDLPAMEKVWTCAPDNMLIAPPTNPHVHLGWPAIRRNWEAYWPTFDKFQVSMRINKINVSGPVAWVHGVETSHRRAKSGEISSSHNYGTNIFVHRDNRWLMVFHQAAAIPDEHIKRQQRKRRSRSAK